MPPPYAHREYRGYCLVQWSDGGPVELSFGSRYISTEPVDLEGAERIVDEWLDAP